MQHALFELHTLNSQHGPPFDPHALLAPPKHTLPAVVVSPLATHDPDTQQPSSPHLLPAQHTSPRAPHALHVAELHTMLLPEHVPPADTHLPPAAESQQPPPLHALPAQHRLPAPPHAWHDPPLHTVPADEHCAPLA